MTYIFEHGGIMAYVCRSEMTYEEDPKMFGDPISTKLSNEDWDNARHIIRWSKDRMLIGFTDEENAYLDAEIAAENAHKYLEETDYVSCKIADGSATREEYADVIASRQDMRDVINRFEEMTKPASLELPKLQISNITDKDLNTNPFPFIPPVDAKEVLK